MTTINKTTIKQVFSSRVTKSFNARNTRYNFVRKPLIVNDTTIQVLFKESRNNHRVIVDIEYNNGSDLYTWTVKHFDGNTYKTENIAHFTEMQSIQFESMGTYISAYM